jgi:hypothetical protein
MLLKVSIPVDAGNKGVKEGTLPKTMMAFVDHWKPEATYFTAENGMRTAYFVFDLKDPTLIPSAAEPFFSNLNASVEFKPVMNLEEMRNGVDKAMKQHT